jgi:DNA polymerase III alpha subunit (gram-positive type)
VTNLFSYNFDRIIQSSPEEYILEPGLLVRDLFSRKLLIVDIEATGLDVSRDEITEIAAQEYDPVSGRKGDVWRSYIHISGQIPLEISRLTSITRSETDAGISASEALSYLASRYSEHVWIAQCGFEFDFPFLERVFGESELPPAGIEAMDTKVVFAVLHPELEETFSTNFLATYFRIDSGPFARHTAAGDVALITEMVASLAREAVHRGVSHIDIRRPLTIKKFIPQPLL